MGYVRVWWPPVVLGLVIAFLGIGVVEVAGLPAGSESVVAREPIRPQSRQPDVAPAAIERYDDTAEPEPQARVQPRVRARVASSSPEPEPSAAARETHTPHTSKPPRPPAPRPQAPRSLTPRPVLAPSPSATVLPPPSIRPTPPPVRPVRPVRPAEVLDLRAWKLTLPIGQTHHPMEIRQPRLNTFGNGPYFRSRPDRGVLFRAPVGGVTTENSAYPRAELREMTADGQREAGWSSTSGHHVMTLTQAITATPRAKPHVVAGQIHDDEDDVAMIRLEGRRLFVESDGDDLGVLDPDYRLGRRFTVRIVANASGVRVTYNGRRTVDIRRSGHGWYFKAGCYVQSNLDRGDRPAAYGEVVIYALSVRHAPARARLGPGRPVPR